MKKTICTIMTTLALAGCGDAQDTNPCRPYYDELETARQQVNMAGRKLNAAIDRFEARYAPLLETHHEIISSGMESPLNEVIIGLESNDKELNHYFNRWGSAEKDYLALSENYPESCRIRVFGDEE